jgi:LPS export ABC transporter protein LptC
MAKGDPAILMIKNARPKNPEKIKFIFYGLILMIFLFVLFVFLNYRFFSDDQVGPLSLKDKATLSLDKVDHTATKNGIKQWSLKAKTANFYQGSNEARFNTLTLVFYTDNGQPVTLTADNGRLDTETNDISTSGNVVVVNGPYTLETETLQYNNKERILTAPVPAKITNELSHITADRMTMDLNTTITVMDGNVKGVIHGIF